MHLKVQKKSRAQGKAAHLDPEVKLLLQCLLNKIFDAHSRLAWTILQHVGSSVEKVRATALGRNRREELTCHLSEGLHLDARVDFFGWLISVDSLLQEHELGV